jgi:hypothetical protein
MAVLPRTDSAPSTILNETNLFNRDWIERQLSHVERNEVRRAYNAAEWMSDRRRMMQWWADHITALLSKPIKLFRYRARANRKRGSIAHTAKSNALIN